MSAMIRELSSRHLFNHSANVPPLFGPNSSSSSGIPFARSRRHSFPAFRSSERVLSCAFWPHPLLQIDQILFVDARAVLASPEPVRCEEQGRPLGEQLEALKGELKATEFRLQTLLSLCRDVPHQESNRSCRFARVDSRVLACSKCVGIS